MPRLIKPRFEPKPLSVRQFYQKRNEVLILRETGGLGDILMHRMMFEDFKDLMPDCKLIFACPSQYHEIVKDHPFLDGVLDSRTVNVHDYVIYYNTTSACCRYEMKKAPYADKHRSDIWANHCGIELKKHNMHLNVSKELKEFGYETMQRLCNGRPTVLIAPISAMFTKNLLYEQLEGTVQGLRDRGYFVCSIHSKPIDELERLKVPTICGLKLREWMAVVDAANYVISVDTSTFHLAGGLSKPLVGIFTFADGKVYGKYFDFELVQKHRDNGDWDCGPCYSWCNCIKTKKVPKPCLTEITSEMILEAADRIFLKRPILEKI